MTSNQQHADMSDMWSSIYSDMLAEWLKSQQAESNAPSRQIASQLLALWHDAMTQANHDTDPTARHVMHRLFASQLTTIRLIKIALETWQAIHPSITQKQNWQSALDAQMDIIRHRMEQPIHEQYQALDESETQWKAYIEQLDQIGAPLHAIWQQEANYYERLLQGDMASLVEMSSIHSDMFQDSFGSLLNMPQMDFSRDFTQQIETNFLAWVTLQRTSYDYQLLVVDAWLSAFKCLMSELAQLAEHSDRLDSVSDFLNRWSALADSKFKKTFESEQYIKLQGQFVNAVMNHRQTLRLLNETMLKMYDIPTRSEVDEAHRRIHEMRKEIRALQREIANMKRQIGNESS